MARWEFKLPDIGEGVAEGEIVSWLVKPGDVVGEDHPMVEVMTDKATVTIGAPRSGTIVETRGKVGDVVAVHAVLVVFELDAMSHVTQASKGNAAGNGAANGTAPGIPVSKAEDGPAATAVGDIRESLPGMGGHKPPRPEPSAVTSAGSTAWIAPPTLPGGIPPGPPGGSAYFNDKPLATPATRQMARDLSVDLKCVKPTGPQGRVTKQDVLAFSRGPLPRTVDSDPEPPTERFRPKAVSSGPIAARELVRIVPPARSPGARGAEGPLEERVPFAGLRRKIATKMALSKHTAAHFTFVEECDVTALKALRARMKGHAESLGVKLTFLPFIVKACVAALKRHPILNSALDESTQELVYRRYYDIGVAASTDAGLIVPVVRDADKKSFLDIARDIDRVSSDAKAGKSRAEDLSGSTFTITSLGAQSGLLATPILNFPEVGILGVHRMKERPVVKDGRIVIGDVMLLSLSFDHRIVDGHVGAAFAYELIGFLEEPDKLLLEMA